MPTGGREKILDVAARLAGGMGVELTGSYTRKTLEKPFYGVYYGQAALPIAPEEMNYLTGGAIDTAAVYNYETDTEGGIYDAEKAAGRDPYEMFLSWLRVAPCASKIRRTPPAAGW